MSGDFDRAGRALAALDPPTFMGWLLGLNDRQFRFVRWLNASRDREPGETELTNDKVAHLVNHEQNGRPWAVVNEFETESVNTDFARLATYGAEVWKDSYPDELRGSEFAIGIAVVYLRGKGNTRREFVWENAGMEYILKPRERNLSEYQAKATLDGVVAGTVPGLILAFVPLMVGGDEPDVIEQWRERLREQPERLHGTLAFYTRVFAEAAGRVELWRASTEGWGVIRSQVMEELRAELRPEVHAQVRAEVRAEGVQEGEVRALVRTVLRLLRARFVVVPDELATALGQIADLQRLEDFSELAGTAASLADFRTQARL